MIAEASPKNKYGYCTYCAARTGRKLFRELLQGIACKDCCRKYDLLPKPIAKPAIAPTVNYNLIVNASETPKSLGDEVQKNGLEEFNAVVSAVAEEISKMAIALKKESTKSAIASPKKPPRKRKKTRRKLARKNLKSKRTRVCDPKDLKKEERELVLALKKLEYGYQWHKPVAKHLGWTPIKVRTVAQRLFKKGYNIVITPEERMLDYIRQNPWSSPAELREIYRPKITGKNWLYELLERLVQQKKVICVRSGAMRIGGLSPFRYCATEECELNFLAYSLKKAQSGEVGCICTYSQKFAGYGIFTDVLAATDPRIIASVTRKLDAPAIAIAPISEFQTWLNAHSLVVGLNPDDESVLKNARLDIRTNYFLAPLIAESTTYQVDEVIRHNLAGDRAQQVEWKTRNYATAVKACLTRTTQIRDLFMIVQSRRLRSPDNQLLKVKTLKEVFYEQQPLPVAD